MLFYVRVGHVACLLLVLCFTIKSHASKSILLSIELNNEREARAHGIEISSDGQSSRKRASEDVVPLEVARAEAYFVRCGPTVGHTDHLITKKMKP